MKTFIIGGYDAHGSGPCGYEIVASSEEEAISIFEKEYPNEACWGIYSVEEK
jgi:hypothetical protein